MSRAKPYNNHPSYNHWNVMLWFLNDESMYNYALETSLHRFVNEVAGDKTPDGVRISKSTAAYAWKAVHDMV